MTNQSQRKRTIVFAPSKTNGAKLTTVDAGNYLRVSVRTVTRWIHERGLPARRVDGRYFINRTELLEWALANRVEVHPRVLTHSHDERRQMPGLADALGSGGVFHGLKARDKVQALTVAVQVLPIPASVDRDQMLHLLLAREKTACTGFGEGIAIPHVRNPIVTAVTSPMLSLCFFSEPVPFEASDGRPVKMLFTLLCPTIRSHLEILARLCYGLHDAAFKNVVMREGKRDELLREARRLDVILTARPPTVPVGDLEIRATHDRAA